MSFPPENLSDLSTYLSIEPEGEKPLLYPLQIGRLFCAISLLEQETYGFLIMQAGGDSFKETHKELRKSTFGQLVGRLNDHGVEGRDLRYLRRINRLRVDVVHSLFWYFPFPGEPELQSVDLKELLLPLEKMQKHFRFAERNLYKIVARARMVEVVDLGSDGAILYPAGFWDETSDS